MPMLSRCAIDSADGSGSSSLSKSELQLKAMGKRFDGMLLRRAIVLGQDSATAGKHCAVQASHDFGS